MALGVPILKHFRVIDLEGQDHILRYMCSWWTSASSGEVRCLVTAFVFQKRKKLCVERKYF